MKTIPVKELPKLGKFINEHEVVFTKYTVRRISKAVNKGLDVIGLFKAEDNSIRAWIKEGDYIVALEKALKVLIKEEEYEYAATARKLIDTIQINNLIKETAKLEE